MTGAQDDLRRVTDMADRQIKQLGMNDAVGNLSFSADSNGLQPYSQRLQHIMDMVCTCPCLPTIYTSWRHSYNHVAASAKCRPLSQSLSNVKSMTDTQGADF